MDEALTKGFSEVARTMNLTNEQANQMAAFGFQYGQQVADALRAQEEAKVAQWGESAKAELGADFAKTLQVAGAGIEAVEKVIPNIRQALRGEDRHFCVRAACAGFEMWADTHCPPAHLYTRDLYEQWRRDRCLRK